MSATTSRVASASPEYSPSCELTLLGADFTQVPWPTSGEQEGADTNDREVFQQAGSCCGVDDMPDLFISSQFTTRASKDPVPRIARTTGAAT